MIRRLNLCTWLLFTASLGMTAKAQQPDQEPETQSEQPEKVELPKIEDEPKVVDPATLISPKLAVKATHDFSDSSLREVVSWLQDEHKMVVLVDRNALAKIGVSPAEPISDRLSDDPIYLLLNRLRSLKVDWFFDDETLHITSVEVAEARASTLPYNVGDLLDAGYDLDSLERVIETTISPDDWSSVGGDGELNSLGDVLFVRQNDRLQRQVKGLLEALRGHARQTFVNDPPQHLALRQRLLENVDVNFEDTPLEAAIDQLAELADIDIRLDVPALRAANVREREPIRLKLAQRKLATVLQAVVLDLELTWIMRDGVLWITTPDEAESFAKTAVYDVRDLCRDNNESDALINAILSQTAPASWDEVGGPGTIDSPKPGTLVISHEERIHDEVLSLLETYRTALRSSKPRKREKDDPNKLITVYYRTHASIANDLERLLPTLVQPDSWKRNEGGRQDAKGELYVAASEPELRPLSKTKGEDGGTVVVERAVLIVKQTRAVQDEVQAVLQRVEMGDALGGSGGGGGFGGGFFSIPERRKGK